MILDLILIIVLLLICFIGYKVGFLTTLIKMASAISGLIIAIVLTKPVTTIVTDAKWDREIETNIYQNITTSEAFEKYNQVGENEQGLAVLLEELGIPHFLSETISHQIADSVDPTLIATTIADKVSYAVMCVIVFICLLIFSSLFFFILKKIVQGTRKSVGFFRTLDGMLGIAFYAIGYLMFLYLGFWILSLVMPALPPSGGFVKFMNDQLSLNSDEFHIGKYLYQNNVIKNFFELIF